MHLIQVHIDWLVFIKDGLPPQATHPIFRVKTKILDHCPEQGIRLQDFLLRLDIRRTTPYHTSEIHRKGIQHGLTYRHGTALSFLGAVDELHGAFYGHFGRRKPQVYTGH